MSENNVIRTLTIDIGGSGIKVMILDEAGNPITERLRQDTPQPAQRQPVLDVISSLAAKAGEYDRISVGFPGVVQKGVIKTAVNLHPDWVDFDIEEALNQLLNKPVKVANDADIQGFAAISGQGVEMVITLGTGMGSALFINGVLVPNLELGHHPVRKRATYEQQLGREALEKDGEKKWNEHLQKAIAVMERVFNYNTLYIGGGETKHINFNLPSNVKVVPNVAGLLGGIALWR